MSDDMKMVEAYKALAKAQGTVFKAVKDATADAVKYRYRYATLANILDIVRGPLADNGFAMTQDAETDTGGMTVSVTTALLHSSGAVLTSAKLSAPLRKEFTANGIELPPSIQAIGSMVTYLRRYSLCAFLSVAVDDDDDGAAAVGNDGMTESRNDGKAGVTEKRNDGKAEKGGSKPNPSNRVSVHTGEKLDSPEAVARHKEAGKNDGKTESRNDGKGGKGNDGQRQDAVATNVPWPKDARLVAEMEASVMSPWMLDGYLRGTYGNPRISKPLLTGGMTVDMLGAETIGKLLQPVNWKMVRERVANAEECPL